jgi:hypothetical protein
MVRLSLLLLVVSSTLAGCGGDGSDGPKSYKSGTHVLDGTCDLSGDGIDTYRVRPGADGTLAVTLVWDESGDLVLQAEDWDSPPGDSPAQISDPVSDGTRYDVDAECLSDSDGVSYEITITVP